MDERAGIPAESNFRKGVTMHSSRAVPGERVVVTYREAHSGSNTGVIVSFPAPGERRSALVRMDTGGVVRVHLRYLIPEDSKDL